MERPPTKRELAAEVGAVLAFAAQRNNDKVGLTLFTERVEKYVTPAKGNRHVLRVVRDILGTRQTIVAVICAMPCSIYKNPSAAVR